MKIAYFSAEDWEHNVVKKALPGHAIEFFHAELTDHEQAGNPDTEALCVFSGSTIDKKVMSRFPKLRLVATRSTGFDHIDLLEAKRRKITVVNVPTYGEHTVAEFAFALILTLSRRVYDAYHRIAETGSFSQDGLRGFDLKGKTLGVVGTGNIGRHVARIAKGFEMNVIASDPHEDREFAHELDFHYVSFEELIGRADIITLHVPYNMHTHHLINEENIGKIKKGAYLINTSRGAVVETEAIVRALKDEILAGAGLDVLEEEGVMGDEVNFVLDPHPNEEKLRQVLSNHYLIDHPRVIITPHNAFNTKEALERIVHTTIQNIKAFGSGRPQNVVKI